MSFVHYAIYKFPRVIPNISPPIPVLPQPAEIVYYPGFAFERTDTTPGSVSDGLPSVGLPADDVDFYTGLRDVSAKIGVPEDFWYLIEGSRTNVLLRTEDLTHAEWAPSGMVTVTSGQSDPAGGSTAARAEAASGNHWVIQIRTGQPSGVARTASQWVRQGPGPGTYQWLAAQPFQARGGIAVDWVRETRSAVSTGTTWTHRFVEGQNLIAFGGVAAGTRDAVVAFPQQEVGGWASSYIATAGSARTRGADILRLALPSWWTTETLRFELVPAWSSAELMAAALPAAVLLENVGGGQHIFFGDRSLVGGPAGFGCVLSTATVGSHWTDVFSVAAGDLLEVEVDWNAGEFSVYQNSVLVETVPFAGTWTPGEWGIGRSTVAAGGEVYGLLRILDIPPEWMPQDPQTLEGYTFTRASTATDGLPSVGLPADDVDSYGSNVLRKVSQAGKYGAASDGWVLIEGARTNNVTESNNLTAWSVTGTVTVTPGEAGPKGNDAFRVESLSGTHYISRAVGTAVGQPRVVTHWLRQGPGSGAYQTLTTFAGTGEQARGGTASTSWSRLRLFTAATTGVGTVHLQDGRNLLASPPAGVAAGARDAVVAYVQGEQGYWASSYIPTSGSAATRLGDDLSIDFPERWTGGQLRVEFVPAYSSAERVGAAQNICLLREDDEAAVEVVISGSDMIPRLRTWDGVYDGNPLVWAAGDEVRFEIDWVGGFFSIFINDVYTDDFTFTGGWQ